MEMALQHQGTLSAQMLLCILSKMLSSNSLVQFLRSHKVLWEGSQVLQLTISTLCELGETTCCLVL